MINTIFVIDITALDESKAFVKILEVMLRSDLYRAGTKFSLQHSNGFTEEKSAGAASAEGGMADYPPYRHLFIHNSRRDKPRSGNQSVCVNHYVVTILILIVHVKKYAILLDNKHFASKSQDPVKLRRCELVKVFAG